MKRLFCFLALALACVGNVLAWEPVLVEKHWFSFYEYDQAWLQVPYVVYEDSEDQQTKIAYNRQNGISYNWSNNYLLSMNGASLYDGDDDPGFKNGNWVGEKWASVSFYSILDHQPRFSVGNPSWWNMGKIETHWAYKSYGLVNTGNGGQNAYDTFTIHDLNEGDTIHFEYYRAFGNNDGNVTLNSGSLYHLAKDDRPAGEVNNNGVIYGTDEYVYTSTSKGNVTFNCPKNMLLRSVTIKLAAYQKATTSIEEISDAEKEEYGGNGYRFSLTGPGVLEDKRGAVPYITMRFGAMSDLTYVRDLGGQNSYGEQYGAGCIIDETNDLTVSKLTGHYNKEGGIGQERTSQMLPGKEWTVFEGRKPQQGETGGTWEGDLFDSIYPLYGTYYYFFPEVDGVLNVRFYCEGNREHMPLWYKSKPGENGKLIFISSDDQPVKIKATGLNDGDNSNNNQYFYEYTIEVEKGGVYYLCSNPTLLHQERPVVRLMSYAFVPKFRLDPLWYVATDAEKEAKTVNNASTLNQDFTVNGTKNIIKEVKCLGNIHSANAYFVADNANNKAYLNFSDIVYKSTSENDPTLNDGGAVVVTVECEDGKAKFVLTIPYSAEKAVASTDNNNHYLRVRDTDTKRNPKGKEVKKWDFFSNTYYLGKYSDTSSLLYSEIHKADGLTADWVNTYMDIEKKEEHIFKSVYDMEGDNADMIKETEGLVFFTESNQLGIFNENDPSNSQFSDRYIGLIGGGEMWIPSLKAGDRIVLKMGRYGKDSHGADKAHLTITGAQDAIGTDITGDYVIGGSGVAAGNDLNSGADIKDQSQPWGEYHFISTGGHFKLKVTDATLLKLYSIVIYKHDDTILTENELLGDEEHRQILNTAEFTRADNVQLRMHYRGLNEATNYSADPVAMTGNLQASDVNITDMTSDQSLWYVYSVALPSSAANAKFGVFKARQGVQTIGEDYVTDYADCMIPVGYRETMTYPYTWDFTDLKKYVSAGIDDNGVEKEVANADADLRIWNNWNFRVKPEEWDGNIFVSGGQLYGGKTMFDETRGIGITHDNTNVASMTGDGTDLSGGLSVGNGAYGFIVPQVDKEQAIYVRAAKVGSTQKAKYEMSDGTTSYAYGQAEKDFTYSATVDGEEVFAVVMPSSLTKKVDVKLFFQGYEVKKIAVSTDSKAVNSKGWTSESRDHAIDASLLPYFTGKEMKTYVVSDPNYTDRTLTLTDVGAEAKCVIPASTGCLIYNPDNGAFNPFGTDDNGKGDGFHLFVPDMHDQTVKDSKLDNLLIPNVDAEQLTLGMFDGSDVNYVLAYKYQLLKSDGTPYGDIIEGPEMFYRVSNKGIKLHKNSAYLKLPKDMVMPTKDNPTGHAKFTFFFAEPSETTAIETIKSLFGEETTCKPAAWYNLNGQKLNGKPTKGGLYIVNGKKVLVK